MVEQANERYSTHRVISLVHAGAVAGPTYNQGHKDCAAASRRIPPRLYRRHPAVGAAAFGHAASRPARAVLIRLSPASGQIVDRCQGLSSVAVDDPRAERVVVNVDFIVGAAEGAARVRRH